MIHNSFECSTMTEYILIWFGAWVGMSGPKGIIRAHDRRDWAQRHKKCHPYFAHKSPIIKDAWWQIYCKLELEKEPEFNFRYIGRDPFYIWLEKYWHWQQLPVAIIFYLVGGWAWVIWGVAARIAISNHGHWLIGYFAHNKGPQSHLVCGAGVQAFDVPWAAIVTMGEAWHNNHHAFPGSAKIGLYKHQSDWGYDFIQLMEYLGVFWNVQTPENLPHRGGLIQVKGHNKASIINKNKQIRDHLA
ncbi:acyl-CoA desaturase [Sphingorhabdus lutea]|nr:acyl-CoA desaturase [Sphingorhabdus lutea]